MNEDYGYTPGDDDIPPEREDFYDEIPEEFLFDQDGQGELFEVEDQPLTNFYQRMKHDDVEDIRKAIVRFQNGEITWEQVEIVILHTWDQAFQEGAASLAGR